MTIPRSEVTTGDAVWVARTYVSYDETLATAEHGIVIAADEAGTIVYRDDNGRIHELP